MAMGRYLANASRSFHEGQLGGSATSFRVLQKSKQGWASRCPSRRPRMTASPNALRDAQGSSPMQSQLRDFW